MQLPVISCAQDFDGKLQLGPHRLVVPIFGGLIDLNAHFWAFEHLIRHFSKFRCRMKYA
jgi:hypothetical protein